MKNWKTRETTSIFGRGVVKESATMVLMVTDDGNAFCLLLLLFQFESSRKFQSSFGHLSVIFRSSFRIRKMTER